MLQLSKIQLGALQIISEKRQGFTAYLVRQTLSVASSLYAVPVRLRNYLYDQNLMRVVKLPIAVISVGNITVGGTGKTPMVEWLVKYLQGRNVKTAILSRGYGAVQKRNDFSVVDSSERINDEFLMLRENLEEIGSLESSNVVHLAGPNRAKLGTVAIERYGVQCIVLDDGFQHRRLHRDLDIVLIDCLSPFGFSRILPRGLLREPLHELRRTDIFVLSRTDQCCIESINEIRERIRHFNSEASIVEAIHKPLHLINVQALCPLKCESSNELTRPTELEQIAGKRVYAFCGIGNPQAFRKSLSALNAEITCFRVFPDHHRYSEQELGKIADEAYESKAEMVITTQKDGVKVYDKANFDIPFLMLKIRLEVTHGREILTKAIERHLTNL